MTGRADTHPTGTPPEPPVAAPDHAQTIRLALGLECNGCTFDRAGSIITASDLCILHGSGHHDSALFDALDALLAERQQDKRDVQLALDALPDPMHPNLRQWADKLTDAKIVLAHVAGHEDPGNVEAARAVLAGEGDATPPEGDTA